MSNRRMVSFAAALQSSQEDDDEEEIGSKEEEEDDDEDNDDDPRLSAAALCISFRFHPSIGASHPQTTSLFGPKYTHQCFEGEYIPGYQPFERDVLQRFLQLFATHQSSSSSTTTKTTTTSPSAATTTTTSTTNPVPPRHASHTHFETATHYLRIKIHVAPSCAVCQVHLETHPNPMTSSSSSSTDSHATDPPLKKRPKLEQTDANGSETDDNTNDQQAPMPQPQILKCLEKMLPNMVQRDVRNDFLAQPYGTVLREYHRPTSNNNNKKKDAETKEESFCLCLAHGNKTPGVAAYHNSIQRLALGWIETADAIDITQEPQAGGQYWQILYLFQKHSTTRYSLAGYMTLWTVTSVLARPTPGVLLRITQALLLPHYQRQGHGQEMIRAVYQLAHDSPTTVLSSRPATTVPKPPPSSSSSISILLERKETDYPIVQVNVEDPSPGFTALRNLVDYTMFVENSEWQDQLLWRTATTNNKDDDTTDKPNKSRPLVPLDDPHLMELAHRSKLTPRQVQIVYELFYLRQLQQQQQRQVPATTERDDSSSEITASTRFRLQVKERLYKEHKAMIESRSSKDEMKDVLSQLYEEVVEAYQTILNKVHGTTPNETNNKNNDS